MTNWNNVPTNVSQQQQQQMRQTTTGTNMSNAPPPMLNNIANLAREIDNIIGQQNTLREQIRQSELNLNAQHNVLMQQQQKQIDDAIETAQNDTIQSQADENGIILSEFDAVLQPIIDSCTKDSISAGKNWILQHTSDATKCNAILQYLLKKYAQN